MINSIQLNSAQSAPKLFPTRLTVVAQCSTCFSILCRDCMGIYHGAYFCDECANMLQPDRYNAELSIIVAHAEVECERKLGLPIAMAAAGGRIALVEDDLGDLVYASPNCQRLFTEAAVLGGATTDFLPTEIAPSHRRMHRDSVKTQTQRRCLQTVNGQHWDCRLHPFIVQEETFTLTLFRQVSP